MQQDVNSSIPTVSGETSASTAAGGGVVQLLISDHQRIRPLLDQLEADGAATGKLATIKALQALLTVHNATEENLVYPALASLAGEMFEPRKLYFETAEADIRLFELDEMAKGARPADDFGAKAAAFCGAVRKHMETEEQHAFPHLEQRTKAGELTHLDTAVREFRGKLQFGNAPI